MPGMHGSPETNNVNSIRRNPRDGEPDSSGPEGSNDPAHNSGHINRVVERFVIRPFQGRICFWTLFRGLTPTAIRVHPLRGCQKNFAPCREQLELIEAAEKFEGYQSGHGICEKRGRPPRKTAIIQFCGASTVQRSGRRLRLWRLPAQHRCRSCLTTHLSD